MDEEIKVNKEGSKDYSEKAITPRATDYSAWYLDVIDAAGLAEHAPVKGCMIIKPYGYAIWEAIQKILDKKFKESGVENAYFPLLIPERLLKREEDHVEGFAPEVAVVTHAGGKELEEPLVIRPTSETIMYEVFSKWIHSYRDLPLLINQWANVVRWEMRPRLFLRTTEFLWQEGHTVHSTEKEADERARQMLEVYKWFAEEYLAMPVLVGQKSESEKFAGAAKTYSIEAMMQDGKALQFATSHNLGQNFSKVFDVKFLNEKGENEFGWQTSWGCSTRMIGGLIMTHSDDKGLVLPPRIASISAVIVSIGSEADRARVSEEAQALGLKLTAETGLNIKVDVRDKRPGDKFYEWEKKGVPVRLELGPKDIASDSVVMVRRDTGEKITVAQDELAETLKSTLEAIQKNLFDIAFARKNERTKKADNWEDFKKLIDEGNFVLAHWDGTPETEAEIKAETNATVRSIPFDVAMEEGVCVKSGKPSKMRVIFARSY